VNTGAQFCARSNTLCHFDHIGLENVGCAALHGKICLKLEGVPIDIV
jgi:hypothetical protein